MQSTAATVDEYLKTVPPERRTAIDRFRQLCLGTLKGYEEIMAYGMPSYSKDNVVEVGFNSQKNYISLYVLKKDVVDKYRDQLKDVGKGCIRYRRPEQIDFEIVEKLLEGTAESSAEICPMALRAWFALIRRVRSCSFLPFFTPLALTVCESKEALDQSISPAWLRVSSSSLCSFFQTPAFSQSRSHRQQVIPEPQPISWGSISHCKPDFSTNTMPVSAARSGIRGRPPFGLGRSGGKSGLIISHNSSGNSGFAIPNFT